MSNNREDQLTFTSSSPITVSTILDPTTLHAEPSTVSSSSHLGSASNSFQNDTFLNETGSGGGDIEFGFQRSDFKMTQLAGTVELYNRHVFLCYKNPSVWPARIQAAEFDRLPRLLAAAVSARKADMKRETRLTICEGHDGTETSNGDVLIFPDMVRYRRLTHFDVDTFVEEVLVKDGEWLPGTPETLKGWFVFVCCHGSRDRRCGVCGPPVVNRFREEIETHNLHGKVSVSPCSHIGGHRFAGNVIIFGNIKGKVTGHWYGYVAPEDVTPLFEQHIVKGEIVDSLWRGQMGISEEEQLRSQELRLQLNGKANIERSNTPELKQSKLESTSSCRSQAEATGCCQGTGELCCQNTNLPEKTDEEKTSPEKKKSSKKVVSRINSGSRRGRSAPTWLDDWEKEDTYAVLAVGFAAVSVFVAYSCYKQWR